MSGKYDAARDAFGDGKLSWTRDRIVAQLVSADYAFNPRHTDRRDLKGLLGTPVVLTGRAMERGWAKALDIVFKQVSGGADAAAVVIRRDGAEEKSTTLIVHLDQVEGFPMKTNGGDIIARVPAQGLFRV